MNGLKKIFSNNQKWVARKLSTDGNYFKKLAKGQNPKFLYIGCSDSRVTAEELMGLQPGELFVHRNIANLVVSTDDNLNSVVQFALEHLKVKHIILCGHYECGGVKAALHPSDMGQLNSWLQTLRDVYRLHKDELNTMDEHKKRFDRLVELNVIEQCINLIKMDHVQRSWYKTGFPLVHGWVFNVRTGYLIDMRIDFKEIFGDLRAIYDLKPLNNSNH
ncbi:MAG TPA: carbonic anhydrase [Acidobacteriota bacterium]|nr:carbonic anhydrase [Acidobacteriota bacterium]